MRIPLLQLVLASAVLCLSLSPATAQQQGVLCVYECIAKVGALGGGGGGGAKLQAPLQPLCTFILQSFYSKLEGAMKLNLCHSVLLEMCFSMESFFAKVKIFSFWLKTMDYSQGF